MLGFVKAFDSSSTNSKRSRLLAETFSNEIKRGKVSHNSTKRKKSKKAKIDALSVVLPDNDKMLDGKSFTDSRSRFYFSGHGSLVGVVRPSDIVMPVVDTMKIVEDVDSGLQCCGVDGNMVFRLVPRRVALSAFGKKINDFGLVLNDLEIFMKNRGHDNKRGKLRNPVFEKGNGPYITVGKFPYRNKQGVGEKDLSEFDGLDNLIAYVNAVERTAFGCVETDIIRGLKVTLNKAQISGMTGNGRSAEHCSFPSLALGKNVFLPHHIDKDFFYSIISVVSSGEMRFSDDPVRYFVFGTLGIAVALRPGDILIFNPLAYHSVSSSTKSALDKDVFCLSLYLKSMVVAGNSNCL